MTARQPGEAAKVPRSARKRGRCGERQRNQRLPSSISLQHRTPTEELRWAKRQLQRDPAAEPAGSRILERLGIVGMESIEPVILAALIQQDPLLLIGPHGTGKSYLLNRLAAALRLRAPALQRQPAQLRRPRRLSAPQRLRRTRLHPDAGFDLGRAVGVHRRDLALPPGSAEQAVLHNPRALRAGASAARPGLPLVGDEPPGGRRRGLALCRVRAARPGARGPLRLRPRHPRLAASRPRCAGASDPHGGHAARLCSRQPAWRPRVETGRRMAARIRDSLSAVLARYVRIVCALLRQANLVLSPRRAVMLLRNIAGVHAARLLDTPDADPARSPHSSRSATPCRSVLPAKRSTTPVSLPPTRRPGNRPESFEDSPIHVLMAEPDPLHRALARGPVRVAGQARVLHRVCRLPLRPRRPARGTPWPAHLFESGAAGRLVAAVAEQAAEWYAVTATPQRPQRDRAGRWTTPQSLEAGALAARPPRSGRPGDAAATNLLVGLFATSELTAEGDPGRVLAAWQTARRTIAGAH